MLKHASRYLQEALCFNAKGKHASEKHMSCYRDWITQNFTLIFIPIPEYEIDFGHCSSLRRAKPNPTLTP